jgi:excisionase family DNA binding protein
MSEEKILLKVSDLQDLMGIGREKAYSLMRSKSFPSMKIGGNYFVSRSALDKWLSDYERKTFVM